MCAFLKSLRAASGLHHFGKIQSLHSWTFQDEILERHMGSPFKKRVHRIYSACKNFDEI